jgi:hypothetical protein
MVASERRVEQMYSRVLRLAPLVLYLFTVAGFGCASFEPRPMDQVPFMERAQTQQEGKIRVTAAVLSAKESEEVFDVALYKEDIQPIWLEIENKEKQLVWFLPASVDRDYFSPLEVAIANNFGYSESANEKMNRYFYERSMGIHIAPGSVRSGFIFTHLDEGTKTFNVEVLTEDYQARTFTFFIPVPGLRVDHQKVDFKDFYPKDEIVSLDEKSLRQKLEELPCCVTGKDGTENGDPLNLVVIGEAVDVYRAFIRAGWDETETIYGASAIKTGISFVFGGRYRYSPVSGLYVYGRPQDAALQKARESIHERNHLRLWLTPMNFEGKPVWIGQISRDIGVRFTSKTIVTHKIDPDVDETRSYLIQDLLYSQGLAKLAFVKGVGPAPLAEPRGNLTGDPYFTDGLRAVLWVSSKPVSLEEFEWVLWEDPAQVAAAGK